jgi:hypothetical protein
MFQKLTMEERLMTRLVNEYPETIMNLLSRLYGFMIIDPSTGEILRQKHEEKQLSSITKVIGGTIITMDHPESRVSYELKCLYSEILNKEV